MAHVVATFGASHLHKGAADMGRLLERLLADSETAPAATSATLRHFPTLAPGKVAESQESQGGDVEKAKAQRACLLTLAADELLPAGLVHGLGDDDVTACAGESDNTLRAYLRALERNAGMDAGIVPLDWTTAAQCEGCGPVWLWADAARVVACPWCFRRKAGKAFPRPAVRCGDCAHYLADPMNPEAGAGGCRLGAGRARWPMQRHRCGDMRMIEKTALSLMVSDSVQVQP